MLTPDCGTGFPMGGYWGIGAGWRPPTTNEGDHAVRPAGGVPAASFWARLTEPQREELRRAAVPVKFGTDQLIMRQGDSDRHLVVILSGSAKVMKVIELGIEKLLALCGPGSLIGELAALTAAPRSASVIALEPVHGLRIETNQFDAAARKHPTLRNQLELVLADRLLQADERRAEGSLPRAFPRLASLLADLAERLSGDSQHPVVLRISQPEFASLASTSVATAARFVGRLKDLGLVRTGRRQIIVVDVGELRRQLEDDQ
jgi:CRP/FNR family transcriptional regulator, cyclic AMP receptor protein